MQRRRRWLGHVIRKDRNSVTRTALGWTPDSGRRKRGRPRETWRRTIEAEMKTTGKTWKELEKAAMVNISSRARLNMEIYNGLTNNFLN